MSLPLRNHVGPGRPVRAGELRLQVSLAGVRCRARQDAQSRLNRVKFNLASTDAPLPRVPILPDYVTDVRPGIPCYSPITR